MIVVSGAGLAGLATGAALARAGFDVRVVEAAPQLSTPDTGLVLGVNAVRMLGALGLADGVEAAGTTLHGFRLERPDGRKIAFADFGGFGKRYGRSVVALHRRTLVDRLAEALPDGALQLSIGVEGFEEAEGCVRVRLANGKAVEASLLVAADGVKSPLRTALFGTVPVRYAGHTSWRGIAEGPVDVEPATMVERWGPGRRFGFVPLGEQKVYVYASINAPQGAVDGPDPKAELQERFSDFASPVPELIRALGPSARLHRTDIFELAPLEAWTRGRVTLVGDAAHAMTPESAQGASQTIEDAVVLAASLAASPEDLVAGARAFEAVRRPRAAAIANQSRHLGELAHWRHPIVRALRDALIARAPNRLVRQSFDTLYEVTVPPIDRTDRCPG